MTSTALKDLADHGVSVWLDDLSRERLTSGNLQQLIDTKGIVGVTTNPSIFQAALSEGHAYDTQVRELADAGKTVDEAVFALTTQDVRDACDVFLPVFEASGGQDGRVSIEVDPRLAHDTARTVEEATALAAAVDRPNVLIKIPATVEGLPAISQVLAEGISVNVTLIFSLDRYRARHERLPHRPRAGPGERARTSRASSRSRRSSSRASTPRSTRASTPSAARRRRPCAARPASRTPGSRTRPTRRSSRPRAGSRSPAAGAHPQRPLWASTGVKDPAYPDTMYVTELVAPGTVNTMPEKTLDATADHGEVTGDTVTPFYAEAAEVLDSLERLGISYAEVTAKLEREGVDKFEKSWDELLGGVTRELEKATA